LRPTHRLSTWLEHEDINEVTLATALLPDGYLGHGVWEVPETGVDVADTRSIP
jgi:hypothetical protein